MPRPDAVHPVGATVLATRSRPHERLRRQLPAAVALTAGVVLTLVLYALLAVRERDRQRRAFERRTAEVAGAVEKGLALPVEVLQSVPSLFDASVDVSRREFHDFTAGALARHPAIYALEWLPLVPAGERAAHEAAARADGLAGFELTEQQADGTMVRAGDRPFYLPILYMEPPRREALGFDVASEPARLDPPERAALSGATVASPRIRLVEDPPSVASIALFHPVYRHDAPLSSAPLRRAALRGVAACVFHVAPMVERALGTVDVEGLSFALLDASAPEDAQALFETRPGLLAGPRAPGALAGSVEIPFADRRWALRFVAGRGFAADRSLPMAVLAVGLLGSVLVSGALAGLRHIARLRRQVAAALELGQYTLVERIGEGGMGVVYKARHAMLRRPTAIKLLPPTKSSEALLERFEREVQLTSQLTHPNTIAIYDYGRTADGVLYYVMEYVDGITLDRLVEAHGPLPAARAVFLLGQACGALAEAHERGLVHRDVKPANLMLCVRGGAYDFVKVLDFGLVKQLDQGEEATRPDWVVGTPLYMAPESIRSPGVVDPRSDLYALGAVAYFLVTGTQVFSGRNMVEVCSHHLHSEPAPPSERAPDPIPPGLERLILACLAKDPAARPSSARELLAALDGVGGEPWSQEAAREWWERHERRRGHAGPGPGPG